MGENHQTEARAMNGNSSADSFLKIPTLKIEDALRSHPMVEECIARPRRKQSGDWALILYVVLSHPCPESSLRVHLKKSIPAPDSYTCIVPLTHIPLTESGLVDDAALRRIPILEPVILDEVRAKWRKKPGVENVEVRVEERVEPVAPLHLSDLLPNWKIAAGGESREVKNETSAPAEAPNTNGKKTLSLREGEELRWSDPRINHLGDLLIRAANAAPNQGILCIEADGSENFDTYPELLQKAGRIAAGLRRLGLKPQDKVIFQLERNSDFIAAFWGCALGGFVPVPLSMAPSYTELNSTLQKLYHAWRMLDRPVILSSQPMLASIQSISTFFDCQYFQVESVEELLQEEPIVETHDSQPEDIAILLLTSGSTGLPKAVMQSHRSLITRSAATVQMNGFTQNEVSLNWFPLDHVGGIVMFHLRDVFLACNQIQAKTDLVLQEPLRWLDLIERHRVTVTWAPNFAFGLINDREDELRKRKWDLSSLWFILNGGEAIVPKTARRFMQLLASHGLGETAMRPAWGMSETSSGVTYSDRFLLSMTGDDDHFTEVGAPIPGISIRIVDEHDEPIQEGSVGRLQIKGSTVTTGYYGMKELNQEVFTADGWFKTGDLALLKNGRLTITGREKDVIIINGHNYYSHEIEKEVEAVEGVTVSYTAAVGVREPGGDTDRVAIFFHPATEDEASILEISKKIREWVVSHVGINPSYVIPVAKAAIPKTGIGKIQRTLLSRLFQEGEFDDILKRSDILLQNKNTLPDWFYTQTWRRKDSDQVFHLPPRSQCLILGDEPALINAIIAFMPANLSKPIVVESGVSFSRLDAGRFRLNPESEEDCQALIDHLKKDNVKIDRVIHAGCYAEEHPEITCLKLLEKSQKKSVLSTLFVVRALQSLQNDHPIQWIAATRLAQAFPGDISFAYELASIAGVIHTLPQEYPWIQSRWIDFGNETPEEHARILVRECFNSSHDRIVAFRKGWRWIPQLKKVEWKPEESKPLPFRNRGLYVLTGGLGGIGMVVARHLLTTYQARILLLGRSPLSDGAAMGAHGAANGANGANGHKKTEKARLFQELNDLPGEVRYEAVDLGDETQVRKAIIDAQRQWKAPVEGVIHLAGTFESRPFLEESNETITQALRAKVAGTWVLNEVLRDYPDVFFVYFSSINGFFGGFGAAAYSAANAFLDAYAEYQARKEGRKTYCIAWSQWNNLGLSRDYEFKDYIQSRGYYSINAAQGLTSWLAGMQRTGVYLMAGLNGSHPLVQKYLLNSPPSLLQVQTDIFCADPQALKAHRNGSELRDGFGNPIPYTETIRPSNGNASPTAESLENRNRDLLSPTTEMETMLAKLWQEALHMETVAVDDNFFDLGGNSVLMAQVSGRLQKALNRRVSMVEMFQYPTVQRLARHLENGGQDKPMEIEAGQNRGILRREARHRRSSRRVEYSELDTR